MSLHSLTVQHITAINVAFSGKEQAPVSAFSLERLQRAGVLNLTHIDENVRIARGLIILVFYTYSKESFLGVNYKEFSGLSSIC